MIGVFALAMIMIVNGSAYAYSRTSAANYAQKYAKNYNVDYAKYSSDCANFASQCLKAGGFKTNSTWYGSKDKNKNTMAWINCESQKKYLENNKLGSVSHQYKGVSNAPDATSYMSNGDLVYYDWTDDGVIDHVSVGSMTDSQGRKYVCAHTSDRKNEIWSLRQYVKSTHRSSIRYRLFKIK